MPNQPLPIRPGANTTVPFGLPTLLGPAVVPVHQGVPNLVEAVDLWVAPFGNSPAQATLSFTGTAATIVVNFPVGNEAPARVLDGVPLRGVTVSGAETSGQGAAVAYGNVVRNSPRRPLQPTRTGVPSGAPVNLSGVGTLVTLHALEPNYTDELHIWAHNPTGVPITDLSLGVAGTGPLPPPFVDQVAVAKYSTIKVLNGVTVRGDSTAATQILAQGDAGLVVFGFFVRY